MFKFYEFEVGEVNCTSRDLLRGQPNINSFPRLKTSVADCPGTCVRIDEVEAYISPGIYVLTILESLYKPRCPIDDVY